MISLCMQYNEPSIGARHTHLFCHYHQNNVKYPNNVTFSAHSIPYLACSSTAMTKHSSPMSLRLPLPQDVKTNSLKHSSYKAKIITFFSTISTVSHDAPHKMKEEHKMCTHTHTHTHTQTSSWIKEENLCFTSRNYATNTLLSLRYVFSTSHYTS